MGIQGTSAFIIVFELIAIKAFGEKPPSQRYNLAGKVATVVNDVTTVSKLQPSLKDSKYKGVPSKKVVKDSTPVRIPSTEATQSAILSAASSGVGNAQDFNSAYYNLSNVEATYVSKGVVPGAFTSTVPDSYQPKPIPTAEGAHPDTSARPQISEAEQRAFEDYKAAFMTEASEVIQRLEPFARAQRDKINEIEEANLKAEKEIEEAQKEIAQQNKAIDDKIKQDKIDAARKMVADAVKGAGGGENGNGNKGGSGEDEDGSSKFAEGTPKVGGNNLLGKLGDEGVESGIDGQNFASIFNGEASNRTPSSLPPFTLPNSTIGNNLLQNLSGAPTLGDTFNPGSKSPGSLIANSTPFKGGAPQEPPPGSSAIKGSPPSSGGGEPPPLSEPGVAGKSGYNPFKTYAVGEGTAGSGEEENTASASSSEVAPNRRVRAEIAYPAAGSDGKRPRGLLEAYVGNLRKLCTSEQARENIGLCVSSKPNHQAILSAMADLPM